MKKLLILIILCLGLIGTSSAGEVETNILKLKALNSCEMCNLVKADLSEATFCNTKTPWGIDDSGC